MDGIWGVGPPKKFGGDFLVNPWGVENGTFSTWVCMICVENTKIIHPDNILTHFDP